MKGLSILILPSLPVSASTFRQPVVPPASREVPYRTGRRRTEFVSVNDYSKDGSWKFVCSGTRVHDIDKAKDGIVGSDRLSSLWNVGLQELGRRFLSPVHEPSVEDLFLGGDEEFNLTVIRDKEQNETDTSDGSVFTFSDRQNNTEANDITSIVGTDNTALNFEFQPIRMQAFLSEESGGGQFLSSRQQDYLMLRIIRPALIYWSAALRVEPVTGNLVVDRTQLGADESSCGPLGAGEPRVKIPIKHLESGVENADFLLYVNLAFRKSSKFVASHNNEKNDNTIEDKPDTCSGEYMAASSFCSTDQNDRPIAAILHLCIDDDFFDETKQESNIMVVLHELGHALGFNSVSLAHFRHPDGTPRTPRDPVTGAVPLTAVVCAGPADDPVTLRIPLPSTDVLQFRTVRGGLRVAEIVTPLVRQVVRNHFDCQVLPGAELESGEPTSCLGDHWERRLFKTELLNPLIDEVPFSPLFSSLTLAYFADSGFYQVDLSRLESAAGWGRAAGCDFVEKECVRDGQVPEQYESFFCAKENEAERGFGDEIQGCTHDLVSKAFCSLANYDGELPPVFQYFNGSNVGGNDPFMDYCPVYAGFANGLCSDKQNEAVIRVNGMERFGRPNSRCLSGMVGSLILSDPSDPLSSDYKAETTLPTSNVKVELSSQQTAMCIPIACVVEDQSLRVQVDGFWEVCKSKGDVIIPRSALDQFHANSFLFSSDVVSVVCPDPVRVCPTFYCKGDCLGTNQVCDYEVGECVCPEGAELDHRLCKPVTTTAFFKPEKSKENGLQPDPNDPVAAIYVPRARSLRDESKQFWSLRNSVFVASGVFVFSILISFLCGLHQTQWFPIAVSSSNNGPDDSPDRGTGNPEKLKMVASMVLDLRINDPAILLRDPLQQRDSETEMSATDTEGSLNEHSFVIRQPTIADISEQIELSASPSSAPTVASAPSVRRRGIFSRTHWYS